jgi:thiamine-phosphate pyrophosphorylase
MRLGEAGADYVAFALLKDSGDQQDAHDARLDLVTWWADIFEIPVVAFDIETTREATELTHAGADFIAATVPPDLQDETCSVWAAALIEAVRTPADAA